MNNEFVTKARKDPELAENEDEKPIIYFLYKDGDLKAEPYKLENNIFMSAENEHIIFGKIELYSNREIYYLKSFKGGRSGEIIPDPHGFMSKDTDLSAKLVQRGSRFCEYLRVKPELFVNYRHYLQTRNDTYFTGVVNAIKNGENYGSY